MHQAWLLLPLLSSYVTAFYPYHRGDHNGSGKDKRFLPIHTSDQPTGAPGVFTLDLKRRPTKRDNNFPVVLSSKPTEPNAMAIDQDGSDYSYFSTVKFGSSGTEMYMLIDTGSANTWVMGSSCTSNSCKIHNTFGAADSTTLNVTKTAWSLSYGTGEVQGNVANDTVSFANFTVGLGFGLATTASDDFDNYPMDGILGLGRASSDELGTATVMQVLDSQANLANNIVGVHLQRAADGSKDGQITFGGIDNTKFSGKLSYTKTANNGSWEIAADDAGVDGTPCNFTGKSAIIDTGTSYILMPPADAQTLHSLIPGSSHNGEQYVVPCDATAQVHFTFSGVQYTIPPKDYVGKSSGTGCSSNVIGHQAFGPNQWILGDVFLKNVYSVFDFDKGRIGFGVQAANNAPTASTSNSPSSATVPAGSPTTPSGRPATTMATATTGGLSPNASKTASPSPATSDSSPFGGSSTTSTSGVSRPLSSFTWMSLIALCVGGMLL